MAEATPFRTWNGRDPFEFVDGVRLHAIGGEQVLLCRVRYEPGKRVALHAHPKAEQVMAILAGEVTMTIGDETRTLRTGYAAVVHRGREHDLVSEPGLEFVEPPAPPPPV